MTDHDNTLVPDVMLNGRWPLTLPRARAERAEWHTDAGWERARLDAMHHAIEPGDLVCYLGAECGDMPALVASWGADMILVEPNWKAWPMIRRIWQANDLPAPVATFDGFAGDVPRKRFVTDERFVVGGWPPAADGTDEAPYDFRTLHSGYDHLPVLTVDQIRGKVGRRFDFVSLDIEGAEMRALVGAKHTLLDDRPVVFCSTHPDFLPQYGDTVADLHGYLAGLGYECTELDRAHEVHERWDPIG